MWLNGILIDKVLTQPYYNAGQRSFRAIMLCRVSYRVLQVLCVLFANVVRTRLFPLLSHIWSLWRNRGLHVFPKLWQFSWMWSTIHACSMLILHILKFCYMILMFLGENLCWAGGCWGDISHHLCSKCACHNWPHNWQISAVTEG